MGLTNVLMGNTPLEEALQKTSVDGLGILVSGPFPPNPSELLGSSKMREVINQLKHMADIILVDTPPATVVTDAAVLSSLADGVLIVASAGVTTREMAKNTRDVFGKVNAKLLGVVLNNVEPGKKYGYYKRGYYYYRYGSYVYGERERKRKRARKKE